MNQEAAEILASTVGFVVTRISPTLHGTKHIPLTPHEEAQLAKALKMVMERRAQVVLEAGDDLLALGAVLGLAMMKREAAARLEVEARAAAEDEDDDGDEAAP